MQRLDFFVRQGPASLGAHVGGEQVGGYGVQVEKVDDAGRGPLGLDGDLDTGHARQPAEDGGGVGGQVVKSDGLLRPVGGGRRRGITNTEDGKDAA